LARVGVEGLILGRLMRENILINDIPFEEIQYVLGTNIVNY